jgi:uncharacterized lipoprotein YajG
MRTQLKRDLHNPIRFSHRLKLFGILLTMAFVGTGCGLINYSVVLSYDPQTNVEQLKRAGVAKVRVEIYDARPVRDQVGYITGNWGMKIAPIIPQNDVADLLKRAIETELKDRGFELANGPVQVLAELSKYYSDFKFDLGSTETTGVAEVVMNIQVKKADQTIYSKLIAGKYKTTYVRLPGGKDAQIALDKALKNAMSDIFADPAFIDSLFKASSD